MKDHRYGVGNPGLDYRQTQLWHQSVERRMEQLPNSYTVDVVPNAHVIPDGVIYEATATAKLTRDDHEVAIVTVKGRMVYSASEGVDPTQIDRDELQSFGAAYAFRDYWPHLDAAMTLLSSRVGLFFNLPDFPLEGWDFDEFSQEVAAPSD